ncbi:MAG: TonB-dependent receptor [Wenzhouxiangellaceae bacterium]|nr:TonB-dependent receptor [Wenzhouxiangellaceae bacterium]
MVPPKHRPDALRGIVRWLVVLAVSLPATLAPAQEGLELEPLEVRAARATVALSELPAAVTVIDGEALRRGRDIVTLADALQLVPGLFVQNAGNFAQDARIALRGFGARASFGIRGVAIIVDGIPVTLPDGQAQVDAIDLGDVERIEILRGPVSALYGNAAGGVIRITTRGPQPGGTAHARQAFGSHGRSNSRAGVSAGSETLAWSLDAARFEQDGFRRHAEVLQRRVGSRLDWTPGPDTRWTASVGWFDAPEELDAGGVTAEQAARMPRAARDANVAFDAGESLEQWRAGTTLEHEFDAQRRIALTAFGLERDFENRLPFRDGGQVEFDRRFAGLDARYEQGLALTSRSVVLTAGIDLRHQRDDRRRYDNLSGRRGALVLEQRERVRSAGVYGQARIELAAAWTAMVGLRLDRVILDVDDRFVADGDQSGDRTWEEASPMAGLVWRPRPGLALFANLGTAFQTPTTTELANPEDPGSGGGFNRDLDPQRARSLELGARGSFDGGRWEVAAFRADIDDAITSFEVPGFSGTGRDFFRNAGRSTREGVEAMLVATPSDGLELRAGAAWSDFRFDRFVTPDGDFSGNRLPGVPELRGFTDLSWQGPAGLFAGLTVTARDEIVADNANTASAPGTALVDLRAGREWAFGVGRLGLQAGVENLFDRRSIDNVRVNAFGGRYFEPAPGRTVHVALSWRHGD